MRYQDALRFELFEADIADELSAPAAFPAGSMSQFQDFEYITFDDGREAVVEVIYYADSYLCWRGE